MIPFPRKKLSSLVLLAMMGDGCLALGAGDIQVQSALGSPLEASIALRSTAGLNPDQLIVKVASAATHARFGIHPDRYLSTLQLSHELLGDTGAVRISSQESLSEPYLNLILELRWPDGSLQREYMLLLDPASGAVPLLTTPAVTTASRAPERRGDEGRVTLESTLVTQSGDSLWRLAARLPRPEGTNIDQAMNALYQINPEAFVAGDPRRLRAAIPLRAPSAAQIASAPRHFAMSAEPAAEKATPTPAASAMFVLPGPSRVATGRDGDTPASSSQAQPELIDDSLRDQIAGLKAGVGAIESGKVKSQDAVDQLEKQLNRLVARYEAMSERARALEAELAQRNRLSTATAGAPSIPSPQASAALIADPAKDHGAGKLALLLAVAGIGAGIGARASAHLGGKSRHPEARESTAQSPRHQPWRQRLLRLLPQRTRGSTTYEQPHTGPRPLPSAPPGKPAAPSAARVELSARELREAVVRFPERTDLKLQLLEAYVQSGEVIRFEHLARTLLKRSSSPALRQRIDALRQQGGNPSRPAAGRWSAGRRAAAR